MAEQQPVMAIGNNHDAFHDGVKKLVDGEREVSAGGGNDAADVEAQRKQLMHQLFDGAEVVDLVGHSSPKRGYLRLDKWTLTPDEAARLASYMPPSVKSVRLIGCATAGTRDGREAVEALTRSGRLSASGTLNKVYLHHFDRNGVKRDRGRPPLKEFRPLEPAEPSPARPAAVRTYAPGVTAPRHARLTVPRPVVWLGRCALTVALAPYAVLWWLFRRIVARRGIPIQWIKQYLSLRSTPMPGLLTDPLLTFELTSGSKTWTLQILFDFEYARLYSSTDPLAKRERVYKIRRGFGRVGKTVLEKYLALTRPGVQLRFSHPEAGEDWNRRQDADRAIEAQAVGSSSRSGSPASTP